MAAQLGIHYGSYTRYEQEKSTPRHDVLMRIADAFGYESSEPLDAAQPPQTAIPTISASLIDPFSLRLDIPHKLFFPVRGH